MLPLESPGTLEFIPPTNLPPSNGSHVKPASRATVLEADWLYRDSEQLLQDWERDQGISKHCGPQHVTGDNSQPALENRNDVTSHDTPGLKMLGALEACMLRPRPSPPPFDEIHGILPTSSDGESSPSNPQDDSPTLASSNAVPQESSCATSVTQEIEDEAAKSSPPDSTTLFFPLAPTHTLTAHTLPSPAVTDNLGMAVEGVVRTDDKSLLLMQTVDPAEVAALLNDTTTSSEGNNYVV
jgi:hypothetical protein